METLYARARDGWWLPAIAVLVAGVAVFLAGRSGGGVGHPTAPARMLVASIGGRIELLDAGTGRRARTLSEPVGADVVTPSPDGRFVYFDRPEPRAGCSQVGSRIERLDVRNARVTSVRRGSWPTLSPNGRYLAFNDVAADPCAAPTRVGVIDLARRSTRFLDLAGAVVNSRPVSWSPNSASLLIVTPGDRARFSRATIASGAIRRAVRPVPLVDDAYAAAFYGHADRFVVGERTGDATTVVATTAAGARRVRLFELPRGLLRRLAADPSARRVLVQLVSQGPEVGTDLWVWRRGARAPDLAYDATSAATSAGDAAWAPPTLTARGSSR